MNRHSFSVFLILALALLLSVITVSAQQPRAVPSNDNFINAQAIQIGKSYSVPDITAATNEGGEPTASCKSASVIPHSVWFAFSVPEAARIYLTTFGSLMSKPTFFTTDTVLAVYELTGPGVFSERACVDDANGTTAAHLTIIVNPNVTYYVAAGTFSTDTYLPESTLKLNSRMLATTITPPNFSFETPVNGTDWKVKNASDDQPACSNGAYPAAHGVCVFRFSGTPGVTTKLTQIVPFPPAFLPRKNAVLSYLFYFRVMDTASLGPTKVRLITSYSNGMAPSIHTFNLTGMAAMATYSSGHFPIELKSNKVASIKFEVKFGSPSGTLLVDYVNFFYASDISVRRGGLLPLPPTAGQKK